ncbi:MAG: tetratricopeptide repeat protein [Bryobacterales bacterium]|nr:tetratricopeptide repeat protein [Bryobacterales bacterium]
MRLIRILWVAALAPMLAFAQKKEVQEMQRDVLLMQDQIRTLQRTVDEKMAALTVLVQQTLDSATKANTAVALLERQMDERLKGQEKSVAAPVAGLGAKVDSLSDEFRFARETINEMNSKISKLSTQMTDVSQTVAAIQAPVVPPPGDAGAGGGTSATPPPGVTAESLYRAALQDKSSGKADLALAQFQDFLRWYDNTDLAPNAQFHIGDIYYSQGNYDKAIEAFNAQLEKYPESANKNADALFMKGRALMQLGRRGDAATEYRTLIQKYPRAESADKARAELKNMGLSATPPAARKRR